MQQLSVRLRWFIWEETNGPFKVPLHCCAAAVPCAWDWKRVHSAGNEVRLYGCPHLCVFSRHTAWSDGQNMCVFAYTTDGQCWLLCVLAKKCQSQKIHKTEIFFVNLLNMGKIWLQWIIEFGICNKNCINTWNNKQVCVFIIFEQMKKETAPGATALKADSWPQPDRAEKQSLELLWEQIV